jgi:gamma-glutamylcyclotransferase (GGCT)/AIG2-like uncharacterized protein YtfP
VDLVFVYGTLKRGESNHHWLHGYRFLGRRRLSGHRLHDLGPYPMALPSAPADVIHGELYAVDGATLQGLDVLEDVPNEYERRRLGLNDGSVAWTYLGRRPEARQLPLVPYGDWGTTPVFSYGSNLCPDQLAGRCGGWDGSGLVARLDGWRWGISKIRVGRGVGEGAAGIHPHPGSHCWGVVHHLRPADRATLDRHEGVAIGHYRRQPVAVTTGAGECFAAMAYVPTPEWSATGLHAAADYAGRILRGADHWGLPGSWRAQLRQTLQR